MTAIGKLLALLNLVAGLGLLTWSMNLCVHRPGWFAEPSESVEKGNKPVGFKQLKAEADALYRTAALTSEAWGRNLKTLDEREKYRAARQDGYAERASAGRARVTPKTRSTRTTPKAPARASTNPSSTRRPNCTI